jgi:hypothetical protein
VGGLLAVNANTGSVGDSYSTTTVTGGRNSGVGGLVGGNGGVIIGSFATGRVTEMRGGTKFSGAEVGGLVGVGGQDPAAAVVNSYATGAVTSIGGLNSSAGGLIGQNGTSISTSYSTSAVSNSGGDGSFTGGLIGVDGSTPGSLSDTDWDTDTSGIMDPAQGAGNVANDPGITGLTTAQLQSGLPPGFDPTVWAESPNINGGLPYLLANPPP